MKRHVLGLVFVMLLAACGGEAPAATGGAATSAPAAATAAPAATSAPAATAAMPAATTATSDAATSAPAGTVATAASGAAPSGEPILVGGGFNLTGSISSLDVPAKNGADLALEEINASGGVLGRPLQLDTLDGKSDPTTVGNITTQLVDSQKVVALIGFTDSDSALAAGPITQKAGIPFINVGATSPNLPSQVGNTLFLVPFGDNVQAAAGAEFASTKLGLKTAYLLQDKGSEYTNLLAKYFKERWIELKGETALLGEDTYQSGDKDYSAQLTKIKGLTPAPDFVYISALPDDIGTIVKQARDAGLTMPIIGGDGYDTPLLAQVAGAASDNVYFSTHSLIDAQGGTEPVKQFIAAYQKKYGALPDNAFAALGYDSVKLLADAMKRAGSTDSAAVIKALEETKNYPGVTGSITFSAESHVPQKGVTIIAVKGGKFTLGGEIVPEKVPAP